MPLHFPYSFNGLFDRIVLIITTPLSKFANNTKAVMMSCLVSNRVQRFHILQLQLMIKFYWPFFTKDKNIYIYSFHGGRGGIGDDLPIALYLYLLQILLGLLLFSLVVLFCFLVGFVFVCLLVGWFSCRYFLFVCLFVFVFVVFVWGYVLFILCFVFF